MSSTTQGVVVEVSQIAIGSQLAADAAIGATAITVDDTADFDEAGGTLGINGATMAYVAVDANADVITLAAALTAAASAGDPVNLWDTTRNVACAELVAQVAVSGADANSDPILAVVEHALADRIPEGIRTGSGESVQLTQEGSTWYVTGLLGLASITNGTNWVENSSGRFCYSDTPAAGNLTESIGVTTAGTDAYGNYYLQGSTSYSSAGDGTAHVVALQKYGESLSAYLAPTYAGPYSTALGSITWTPGSGMYIEGGSGSEGITIVPNGGPVVIEGNLAVTSLSAGTGGGWNVVGGSGQPAFASGFGAGTGTPRFRLEPLAGGVVRLDGTVATTAATAAGATMFTLPLGYRPTAAKRFVGVSNASGLTGNTPGATSVQITTAGVVQCVQAASASGQQIVLDDIVFPVD